MKPIVILMLLGLLIIPSLVSISSFEVGVNYQGNLVCSPSSITCTDSKTLRTCSENGTTFTDKKCDVCLVSEEGISQCITGVVKEDNTLIYVLIVAVAIVLGFILLARILKSKKKKHS